MRLSVNQIHSEIQDLGVDITISDVRKYRVYLESSLAYAQAGQYQNAVTELRHIKTTKLVNNLSRLREEDDLPTIQYTTNNIERAYASNETQYKQFLGAMFDRDFTLEINRMILEEFAQILDKDVDELTEYDIIQIGNMDIYTSNEIKQAYQELSGGADYERPRDKAL